MSGLKPGEGCWGSREIDGKTRAKLAGGEVDIDQMYDKLSEGTEEDEFLVSLPSPAAAL